MPDSFTFAGFDFPRRITRLQYDRTRKIMTVDTAYYARPTPITRENPSKGLGFYLDSDFMPGLRWVWCDKADGVRIKHKGWYSDSFQDQTIRGVVFRLPRGRGFLAGHSMGVGMSSYLETGIYDTEREAAYSADRLAERAAEKEREYQEAWHAGVKAADIEQEVADTRKEIMDITAESRKLRLAANGEYPTLCAKLRREVKRMLAHIYTMRDERDKLVKEYSRWNHDAFCEGYGESV